jgi:hypothetical protein
VVDLGIGAEALAASRPYEKRGIGGGLVAPASVRPCDLSCGVGPCGESWRTRSLDRRAIRGGLAARSREVDRVFATAAPPNPRCLCGRLVRGLVRPDQKRCSHQVARPPASNDCCSSADALSPPILGFGTRPRGTEMFEDVLLPGPRGTESSRVRACNALHDRVA